MNRLAELRKEKGLSQVALGKEIGVAQNTLCNWEKGNREIDQESLLKLSTFFKVSIDYLLGISNYRNAQEIQDVAWGITSDPFFEAPFDFCSLLKAIREQQDITVEEMSEVLGCTKEQYEECEEGILPINFDQAEKLCSYLGTNVSQVLFDNSLYDEMVPEEYHDDVRTWEIMKENAENEAMVEQSNIAAVYDDHIRMIPVYESVSAGFGALADNTVTDYQPVRIVSDSEAAETICIRVTGDSMFPKIEDGDIIQVRKQDSVDSGDIAVVLLDGEEGLVKRVVYGETWIELHSINPMYQVQRFEGAEVQRLRVVGLVRGVFHAF